MTVPRVSYGVRRPRGWNFLCGKKGFQHTKIMLDTILGALRLAVNRHGEIAQRLKYNHKVPVYMGPPYYRYMRKKGITYELRNSVVSSADTANLSQIYVWLAEHAKYISLSSGEKNPLIKRARTPGTTLDWVERVIPDITEFILSQIHEEFMMVGLQKHEVQRGFVRGMVASST